jgi:hypothetical protein
MVTAFQWSSAWILGWPITKWQLGTWLDAKFSVTKTLSGCHKMAKRCVYEKIWFASDIIDWFVWFLWLLLFSGVARDYWGGPLLYDGHMANADIQINNPTYSFSSANPTGNTKNITKFTAYHLWYLIRSLQWCAGIVIEVSRAFRIFTPNINKFNFFISVLFFLQIFSSYIFGYWPQSNNIPWHRTGAAACISVSSVARNTYCIRMSLQTPGNFFLWPVYQTTRCHNQDSCRDLRHWNGTLKSANPLHSSISIRHICNFFSFDKLCIFGL